MHIPVQLTEEEELLLQKYAKLKKKMQAVAASKTPKLEKQESSAESLKRPAAADEDDAAFATEQAKKLLQSGAIKLTSERKETSTFKRTKRTKDSDGKAAVSFQPYTQHGSGENSKEEAMERNFDSGRPRPKFNLYDNFVPSSTVARSEGAERERERERMDVRRVSDASKKGQTIYINGLGLTEDILKKACSSFGTIVNISPEFEKNCGFVTFEKTESAESAIEQLNGSMVSDVLLKVSFARRQPNVDLTNNSDQSKSSWSTIAASSSQKGSHKDQRDLIKYDEDDNFF